MNIALNQINWYDVGMLADIPLRGARKVKAGGLSIGVFRTADDAVYALEDRCPHKNGPLSDGIVHDKCVTCPLHNWVISLETGEAQGADSGSVQRIPVRLEHGRVMIGLLTPAGVAV